MAQASSQVLMRREQANLPTPSADGVVLGVHELVRRIRHAVARMHAIYSFEFVRHRSAGVHLRSRHRFLASRQGRQEPTPDEHGCGRADARHCVLLRRTGTVARRRTHRSEIAL
jgi:hypothetical protein